MEREISSWLQTIDLRQYASLFIENGIDLSVLPDLTDRDLEKLRVPPAHRRKLLRAIAELANPANAASRSGRQSPHDGERRQLTVILCELVGLTALSTQLDPEEMAALIGRYQKAFVAAITHYDGIAPTVFNQGVLAHFGYPQAHEDDAERAVRAGLEIIAEFDRLSQEAGVGLRGSIGIATGLVVVGDPTSQSWAHEPLAIGETPKIAAYVQTIAGPGAVAIAASTKNLLGKIFELRGRGFHCIEGMVEPIEVFAVEGLAATESRFEAVRLRRPVRFVGRGPETALLEACRSRAWRGEGQVVLISGDAGIGKSCFALHFIEQMSNQAYTLQQYQCSPFHTSSAFYPAIEQLRRAAGLTTNDPPETQLDKLEGLLTEGAADLSRVAPLFAALLSIPTAARYAALNFSTAQQRRQTLTALVDHWEGLACQQPLVLLWEDIHWADASSLEVLDLLVERIRRLPVLVLMTYRSEFEPIWAGLPNVSHVPLGRLDDAQVHSMIDTIAADAPLPSEVIAQIVAKTDGVALFVEELTKAVIESGVGGNTRALAIPMTLQDSLMARLDNLAHVKDVAQVAAAIGREFTYELLHTVDGRDRTTLSHALAQLEGAELLFRDSASREGRYRFKHALLRDAAYESVTKSRRVVLHRRIADALRTKSPAMGEAAPELVAHHLTEAGLTEAAIAWWSKAGDRSVAQSAIAEASSHYQQAIALADTLPDEPSRRVERLQLQIAYSSTLISVRGHGAPETEAAFTRAWELASRIEDPAERFPVYYGLWLGSHSRAELDGARKWSAAFLREAECFPDSPETGIAYRMVGATAWVAGDFVTAKLRSEQALAAYDMERDRALRFRYGLDPGIVTMLQLAMVLWPLGQVGRACNLVKDSLALALRNDHEPTTVYTYGYTCVFHAMRREEAQVFANAKALAALIKARDLRSNWRPVTVFFEDWTRWRHGDHSAGLSNMRQCVEICEKSGFRLFLPFYRLLLAEVEADAGDIQAALTMMDAAFADTEVSQHRWLQAELHRGRAGLLVRNPSAYQPAAKADLLRSLAIAREQQAKSFELRAALDLASLYGKDAHSEVRKLLSPIVAALEDETQLKELAHAKQLLGA